MNVTEARTEYLELDFEPIPLAPGTKNPLCKGWPRMPIHRQWQAAPPSANIGIRAGGPSRLAILDADEPRTVEALTGFLFGLGYNPDEYPVVQTASETHRHFYATLTGAAGGDLRYWAAEVGGGELRFGPGAFVAAPCSVVGDNSYRLLSGDFRQLIHLAWRDVEPLLKNQDSTPPTRAPGRLPNLAVALLAGNAEVVSRYSSRSEAEQALIQSLVDKGHDFTSILTLFDEHPCAGKYSELRQKSPRLAQSWLARSVREAEARRGTDSKQRQALAALRSSVQAEPWPGRTGAYNRVVLLAHLDTAYSAGKPHYSASVRQLAEAAGVNHKTASKATARLIDAGRLSVLRPGVGDCATEYQVNLLRIGDTTRSTNCEVVYQLRNKPGDDLWRRAGLSKAAFEVWGALPGTVAELAAKTGRNRATVHRKLKNMAGVVDTVTGELIPLVEQDGKTWRAAEGADLEAAARALGVHGMGEREHKKHEEQRRAHLRSLAAGR